MNEVASPSAMCKHVFGATVKSWAEAIRPIRSRAAGHRPEVASDVTFFFFFGMLFELSRGRHTYL